MEVVGPILLILFFILILSFILSIVAIAKASRARSDADEFYFNIRRELIDLRNELHKRTSNPPSVEMPPVQNVKNVVKPEPPPVCAESVENVEAPASQQPAKVCAARVPETESPRQVEREPIREYPKFNSWDTPQQDSFKEKLRAWKILPPEEMTNMESLIMQWWAPRIGGVLALLAMIFFALWASQFSPPWVKVLEMTAVATAFIVLGLFFQAEKTRIRRTGLGDRDDNVLYRCARRWNF